MKKSLLIVALLAVALAACSKPAQQGGSGPDRNDPPQQQK